MSSYPTDDGAFGTDTPIYNSTVGGPAGVDGGLTTDDTAYAATGSAGSTGGKKDAAKDQAKQVGQGAKEAGQHIAGAAKEQAGHVAGEARSQARQLVGQATNELSEQVRTQQHRLAQGVRSFGEEFGHVGAGNGIAGTIARQLSQRTDGVADWLESREPQDVLREVRRFAARRPGVFLALAAGTGLVTARLTKALVADAKHEVTGGVGNTFSSGHDSTYAAGGDSTGRVGTADSGFDTTGTGSSYGTGTSYGTDRLAGDDADTYVTGATSDGSSLR